MPDTLAGIAPWTATGDLKHRMPVAVNCRSRSRDYKLRHDADPDRFREGNLYEAIRAALAQMLATTRRFETHLPSLVVSDLTARFDYAFTAWFCNVRERSQFDPTLSELSTHGKSAMPMRMFLRHLITTVGRTNFSNLLEELVYEAEGVRVAKDPPRRQFWCNSLALACTSPSLPKPRTEAALRCFFEDITGAEHSKNASTRASKALSLAERCERRVDDRDNYRSAILMEKANREGNPLRPLTGLVYADVLLDRVGGFLHLTDADHEHKFSKEHLDWMMSFLIRRAVMCLLNVRHHMGHHTLNCMTSADMVDAIHFFPPDLAAFLQLGERFCTKIPNPPIIISSDEEDGDKDEDNGSTSDEQVPSSSPPVPSSSPPKLTREALEAEIASMLTDFNSSLGSISVMTCSSSEGHGDDEGSEQDCNPDDRDTEAEQDESEEDVPAAKRAKH